jgi:hypothetical protein
MNNRLINTKVAGGGCTDTVDLYNPFPDGGGVALYQLNGDATDVSGNYDGTASNVTYGTGVFGQAGVFNGSNSKITTVASQLPIPASGAFTVSFWAKVDSSMTQYNTCFMSFGDFWLKSEYPNGEFGLGDINTTERTTTSMGYGWNHCVLTVDASNNISLYLNGAEGFNGNKSISRTNGGNFAIGVARLNSPVYYFNGELDQVRIFNTALDPLEVEALYTEELCICDGTVDTLDILGDGSCIATYQLDGNANDLSGNYSGTPTNVSYGVGEFDLAGVFNGSSSQIVLPNSTQGIGDTTASFSFWVKPNSLGSGYGLVCFFTQNDWVEIRYNSSNEFVIYPARQSNNTYIGFSPVVRTPNQWYNIVITRDSSVPNIKLYIDGSLIETNTTWNGTLTTANTPNTIGSNSVGSTLYFNGSIDQVRIFNKALNSTEVTTLYNETACTIPNPIENASFHYDPTTLSDGSVSAWSDGGSINRDLELVSGTTTISKVTSGGIEYVDFSYSASDANVSYLRTGGSTLTTYPDYPTNTSVTFVQFVNINTVYDNNTSYPHIATIFNTLESENGSFMPHIWRSGLSFSYRLGLIMNSGSRFYDIGLATPNSNIRPYGTWKMIGITFEYNQAATSYVKIYIDGALVETWSNTGTWGVLNNTLMLGRRQFSTSNRGGYKVGDTLGFFGEAKTQSEMAEMYKLLKGKYGL